MSFKVGQKVVCIDDSPGDKFGDISDIKKGNIYTVCLIRPENLIDVEESNIHGYHQRRFRPTIESSGISVEEVIKDMVFHEYELTKLIEEKPLKNLRNATRPHH